MDDEGYWCAVCGRFLPSDEQLIAAARIANPYITDADIPLALPQWRKFIAALKAIDKAKEPPSTPSPAPKE